MAEPTFSLKQKAKAAQSQAGGSGMEVRRVRKVCPSCCQERKGRSTRDQ